MVDISYRVLNIMSLGLIHKFYGGYTIGNG